MHELSVDDVQESDRAAIAEEEFHLEKITFRVLLMVEGAGTETT